VAAGEMDNYKVLRAIGKGSFGKVRRRLTAVDDAAAHRLAYRCTSCGTLGRSGIT
jgi:hypothetical protein